MSVDNPLLSIPDDGSPIIVTDQRVNGLKLDHNTVDSEVIMDDCMIIGVKLTNVVFTKKVLFNKCAFNDTIQISNCTFMDGISFRSCNMVFTEINDSVIVGTLDLDTTRFTKMFDIGGSRIDEIDLHKAIVLESFNMCGATVTGGLRMDECTISGHLSENLSDDWKTFKTSFSERNGMSGMAAMRGVLEDEMKYRQADNMFVMQKRAEYEGLKGGRRILSELSYVAGGYGMKPQSTLAFMIALVLAFSLAFLVLEQSTGTIMPEMGLGHWDALYISVDSFFTVGQSDIPEEMNGIRLLSLVEGIIGVFLMFYFTVLLTRKIVR